jgi:hypothetical protein
MASISISLPRISSLRSVSTASYRSCFSPSGNEGGDIDAHRLGDHAGGHPVKAILAEQSAGGGQYAGLHGIGGQAGFLKCGSHGGQHLSTYAEKLFPSNDGQSMHET